MLLYLDMVARLKVLIGCEFSGVVREQFKKIGHDAWSCDFLPSEIPGQHYQCDVRDILYKNWDLAIFHPDCTYLCVSGLHWNKKVPERQEKTEEALKFIQLLMDAPIPRICIENPVGCISTRIRLPDQIIQPFQFGHPESKKTCLWLKNLPLLAPTNILPKPQCGYWENQTPSKQNKLGPSKDRWKLRAKTYVGIATAMATQYSEYISKDTLTKPE